MIEIGKVVNAAALRGEVKIYSYSDSKERFNELKEVFLVPEKGKKETSGGAKYKIEKIRFQKDMVIAKFEGVSDRNEAELLKGSSVLIAEEDLKELPEDTFYIKDLIGCRVTDSFDGSNIGRVRDVIKTGAHDIYQVELPSGREALIPAVGEFVLAVDIKNREITVKTIPGLIPEN